MMNPKQVLLLVDDNKNDVYLLRTALVEAGFRCEVQAVHNGEEAISYLSGEAEFKDRLKYPLPALILLDLNMPKKNGFDVLQWRRTQPKLKSIPVIILTTSLQLGDIEKAFEMNATAFLVKPSDLNETVEMLRTLRNWIQINQFPPNNQMVKK